MSLHHAGFTRSVESVLVRGALAGVLAWATFVAPVSAANSDTDCRLTSRARMALDNDVQLGTLSLGVSVRDEVASVWGSVPSTALADRAVNCLKRVPGVARVENQLTVESPGDPLVDFLKLPARPLSPKPIPGMRVLNPVETAPKSTRTSHGPVPIWQAAPVPSVAPTLGTAEPKLTSRTPEAGAAGPLTMPAIPLPVTRPGAVPLGTGEATPVKAETADLARSIADLQQGNDRLNGIKPEVRGGTIVLRGTIRDWAELHTFARRISTLPGVERVVLDGVRSAR
jgi:osmotically-inducible protein OsmY